jgi:hypothetical protein
MTWKSGASGPNNLGGGVSSAFSVRKAHAFTLILQRSIWDFCEVEVKSSCGV